MAPLHPYLDMGSEPVFFWSTGPEDKRFLSNFAYSPIVISTVGLSNDMVPNRQDLHFATLEHAYQFLRARMRGMLNLARLIYEAPTAVRAKQLGRGARFPPGTLERQRWDQLAQIIFQNLLLRKFSDPELKAALLRTGDRPLIEVSRNPYWGNGLSWEQVQHEGVLNGQNVMGCLLEHIRSHFRIPMFPLSYVLGDGNLWMSRAPSIAGYILISLPHASTEILVLLACYINTVLTNRLAILPNYLDLVYLKLPWNMVLLNAQPEIWFQRDGTSLPRHWTDLRFQLRLSAFQLCNTNPALTKLTIFQYLPLHRYGFRPSWFNLLTESSRVQHQLIRVNKLLPSTLGDRFQCGKMLYEHFPYRCFFTCAGEYQTFLNLIGKQRLRRHLERVLTE